MTDARPKRIGFAVSVLILAGVGIAAFGVYFLVVWNDARSARVGANFYLIWAAFFIAVGVVHVIAGVGAARGRKWAVWLGMIIGFGGALLGAYTLVRAVGHITQYMDVPGTIGLAVVSGLFGLAGWSLLSARHWPKGRPVAGHTAGS